MNGSGPWVRTGFVNVLPPPVPGLKPGRRHTRVPAVLHGSCTRPILAVLSPEGTTHLLEWTACTLNVFVWPETVTGFSRNCWFVFAWQVHWMMVALSAVEAPNTSTHRPAATVRMLYRLLVALRGTNVKFCCAVELHVACVSCSP